MKVAKKYTNKFYDHGRFIDVTICIFFILQPVYLPQAGESTAQYLHFEGCESSTYCDFDKFKESTKEFILTESEFYKICGIKTEL